MLSKALGNILAIGRCHNTYQRQNAVDNDLVPIQNFLISCICREPGCTADSLARRYGLHKTRVTHLLNALAEKEYIRREVSEKDARCRLLFPTQKALDVYPAIHEGFESFTGQILRGLTDEDIVQLTRITSIMKENAFRAIENGNALEE